MRTDKPLILVISDSLVVREEICDLLSERFRLATDFPPAVPPAVVAFCSTDYEKLNAIISDIRRHLPDTPLVMVIPQEMEIETVTLWEEFQIDDYVLTSGLVRLVPAFTRLAQRQCSEIPASARPNRELPLSPEQKPQTSENRTGNLHTGVETEENGGVHACQIAGSDRHGVRTDRHIGDIIDSHQPEERLRLLESAVEASLDAIIITDAAIEENPGPRIVYVNSAFEKITGYSLQEVIGQTPGFLRGPKSRRSAFSRLEHALAAREPVTVEVINYRKDGREYYAELSIVPVFKRGQATHFVGIQRDVDEQKRLEKRLRQLEKMGAIGQFSNGVAHNFNNLLTIIIGCAQLLKRRLPSDSSDLSKVDNILRTAKRGADLVNDLLAFSRNVESHSTPTDLNVLIGDMTPLIRRLIGPHIEIRISSQTPDSVIVGVDANRLSQILFNLTANARDAMPDGGILSIEISRFSLDSLTIDRLDGPNQILHSAGPPKAGDYAVLSISDTGEGMDRETMKRSVEPFFTTKKAGKGTGLGLATVYGVIVEAGGFLIVESEQDRGTHFRLHFPIIDQAHPPGDETSGETVFPVPHGNGLTALVVDDEELVRSYAVEALRILGFRTIEAENSEEALQLAWKYVGPIHVLLTDLLMPGISGVALIEQFSKIRPETKAVFMTGDQEVARSCPLVGTFPQLPKPFTLEILAKVVHQTLKPLNDTAN